MDPRILDALDKAPATVVLLSGPELRYAWMNELFRKLFPRIQVGDAFGTRTREALEFRTLAGRVAATREPAVLHEVEVALPGRDPVWFDLLIHPVDEGVVIVGTNVSEVVKTRRALDQQAERTRLAEARLRSLLDEGPFAIVSFDLSGRVLFRAGAQLADTRVTREATVFELFGDDPAALAALRRAVAGETFSALMPRPNDRVAEVHFSPLRGEDGRIDQVVAVGVDVTARQRLQEKMLQTQKLESLGVLAGGIAHDFNNLLTVIEGNAAVALARLPAGHPTREAIDDIAGAARRAADLTRQMLAYSGRGRFEIRPLDLRQQVREIASLLRSSIPKRVSLRIDEPASLAAVQGDPSQMHQVIMNLVLNAAEAIGDRDGEVTISLGEEDVGAGGGDLVGHEALPDGRYVRLAVSDTGAGMDDEVRARIFDPFFTTKATGRGLGLAAVLGIVRGHGGALRIDSAPGRGTRFDVLLPAAGAKPQPARSGEPSPVARGKGTVLVIDDEQDVRVATARLLSAMGYDVLQASDGQQGAEIFRGGKVDAVLLDLTMPHPSGEQTLAMLRAIDPAVRVVLFSGYADVSEALKPAAVLHKPYTRDQLAAALESALA